MTTLERLVKLDRQIAMSMFKQKQMSMMEVDLFEPNEYLDEESKIYKEIAYGFLNCLFENSRRRYLANNHYCEAMDNVANLFSDDLFRKTMNNMLVSLTEITIDASDENGRIVEEKLVDKLSKTLSINVDWLKTAAIFIVSNNIATKYLYWLKMTEGIEA